MNTGSVSAYEPGKLKSRRDNDSKVNSIEKLLGNYQIICC